MMTIFLYLIITLQCSRHSTLGKNTKQTFILLLVPPRGSCSKYATRGTRGFGLSGEARNNNFIVFVLTRSGLESSTKAITPPMRFDLNKKIKQPKRIRSDQMNLNSSIQILGCGLTLQRNNHLSSFLKSSSVNLKCIVFFFREY